MVTRDEIYGTLHPKQGKCAHEIKEELDTATTTILLPPRYCYHHDTATTTILLPPQEIILRSGNEVGRSREYTAKVA